MDDLPCSFLLAKICNFHLPSRVPTDFRWRPGRLEVRKHLSLLLVLYHGIIDIDADVVDDDDDDEDDYYSFDDHYHYYSYDDCCYYMSVFYIYNMNRSTTNSDFS